MLDDTLLADPRALAALDTGGVLRSVATAGAQVRSAAHAAAEAAILKLVRDRAREALATPPAVRQIVSQAQVFAARAAVLAQHLAPQLEEYLIQLVLATREDLAMLSEVVRVIAT